MKEEILESIRETKREIQEEQSRNRRLRWEIDQFLNTGAESKDEQRQHLESSLFELSESHRRFDEKIADLDHFIGSEEHKNEVNDTVNGVIGIAAAFGGMALLLWWLPSLVEAAKKAWALVT